MTLGEMIRQARKAEELTVAAVAERTGASKEHLWEVEGGRKGASPELLVKLARVLHLRAKELLVAAGYEQEEAHP